MAWGEVIIELLKCYYELLSSCDVMFLRTVELYHDVLRTCQGKS